MYRGFHGMSHPKSYLFGCLLVLFSVEINNAEASSWSLARCKPRPVVADHHQRRRMVIMSHSNCRATQRPGVPNGETQENYVKPRGFRVSKNMVVVTSHPISSWNWFQGISCEICEDYWLSTVIHFFFITYKNRKSKVDGPAELWWFRKVIFANPKSWYVIIIYTQDKYLWITLIYIYTYIHFHSIYEYIPFGGAAPPWIRLYPACNFTGPRILHRFDFQSLWMLLSTKRRHLCLYLSGHRILRRKKHVL